jgi:hypothetical protein
MTPLPVSIAAAVASFLLLLVVFELIRSRRLRERYALLWLLTGAVLLGLSVWRDGLNTIASWFGVETYPPAILGAIGALFILIVLLHYSTVISRLSDQNTILAQRLALLEQQQREGDENQGTVTVTSMTGSSLTVKTSAGESTVAIDAKTKIVGTGLGTKSKEAAAAGKKQVLADVVGVGDSVAVSYHDMAGAKQASEVRVHKKAAAK